MVIDRAKRANAVDRIVVATTTDPSDQLVADLAREEGVSVVRGDVYDVLARFATVVHEFPETSVIVRITADCPFTDPSIIDDVVHTLKRRGADFVANRLPPPNPRTYPIGLDVEACTTQALLNAHLNARADHEREHVMPYLYREGSGHEVVVLNLADDLSRYRWTVDTADDLRAVRELEARCPEEPFGWREVLDVARRYPWINDINAGVSHKTGADVDSRWRSNTA